MPQMSKILQSRDDWKSKAVQRANENREQRKIQRRHQEKIAQLKAQLRALEQANEDKKTPVSPAAPIIEIKQARQVRSLCVLLVMQAVVSYRSVPRILGLFDTKMPLTLGWT